MNTKFCGPAPMKTQNLGRGIPAPDSGNCKFCNEWESELTKHGFCRDEKCVRGRQLVMWSEGKAIIYFDNGDNSIKKVF